jgi:hypothetical protein
MKFEPGTFKYGGMLSTQHGWWVGETNIYIISHQFQNQTFLNSWQDMNTNERNIHIIWQSELSNVQ